MNIKFYKLKKYDDLRGSLIEIIREDNIDNKISQVYISYSNKGAIRGGHYHKRKTEWFTIIKGKANFYFKDLLINQEKFEIFSDNDLILIEVKPYVYHKIESLTDDMILFVAVNEVYDEKDNDTFN